MLFIYLALNHRVPNFFSSKVLHSTLPTQLSPSNFPQIIPVTTMASSIVLSFVGNQDPYSEKTNDQGSIATLIGHLLDQNYNLRRVILLHTQDMLEKANDTKHWLQDKPFNLPEDSIELVPVGAELSTDPVSLLLAVQEARKGLEKAIPYLSKQDRLEFNASSGTPVMKTSWSLLQAAGYAPHSSVWQVRNPKEMKEGQPRVFQTNVDTLKNEFDFKVVKRQIEDYNYSGALVTIKDSNLSLPLIIALLEYGQYRLAFDFNRAFNAIQPFANLVEPELKSEISILRGKNRIALFKEVYFKALIKLKNQEYADFLVDVSRFQEGFLRFLVENKLGFNLPEKFADTANFWNSVNQVDGGKINNFLKNYTLPDGRKLNNLEGFPSRLVLMVILECYQQEFANLLEALQKLNDYCEQRNHYVHSFEGVSELEEPEKIVKILRDILRQKTAVPENNPFNILNSKICSLLTECLHS
jgi:CRISPR-associated protein (Cas_Csm6)